jgi:hypothetical protein
MIGSFEIGSSPLGSASGGAGAPAGVTGTSNVTLSPYTQSAEGSVSGLGTVTGASNVTLSPYTQTAAGVVTSPSVAGEPIKNPSGTLLANFTFAKVAFVRVSDMSIVLSLTNQTSDASGMLPVTSASFSAGVSYIRLLSDATGANVGAKTFTAA